jgi:hypothetical protein
MYKEKIFWRIFIAINLKIRMMMNLILKNVIQIGNFDLFDDNNNKKVSRFKDQKIKKYYK